MGEAGPEVAGYIAAWRPVSVPAQAAALARLVVERAAPPGRKRANALLHAAARLADFAASLGLELVPEVVFHPSVIERFALAAPGLSDPARRVLRTNQRFIARRVVPQLHPPDAALPRERAKAPYSPAEIAGYLALADAQPTAARRARAAGLVCLGAGAGLIRGDLRQIRGADVIARSGGVIVAVRGAAADGAGAGPLPCPAAGRGGVRRGRAGHRRGRDRPQERDRPAELLAGRRVRAAPAGHQPAAGHLAA